MVKWIWWRRKFSSKTVGMGGASTSSDFVSRKCNNFGVGRRFILGFLFSCVVGLVGSSSSSSSSSAFDAGAVVDRKSESDQAQGQEPGSSFLRTRSVAGGGGGGGYGVVDQRGGSSLDLGILATELGEAIEVVRKVEPIVEEQDIAGDGGGRRRIMRLLLTEASPSPSAENSGVKNDTGEPEGSHDKPPQDDHNVNQTKEASNDVGTPPEPGKNDTGTTEEDNAPLQERDCQSEPLFADLKAGDGDGNSGWTLTVNNTGKDDLKVEVIAESLKASPAKFPLKKGEEKTVAITIVDKEKGFGEKIKITWGAEYCQVTVPAHALPPPSQLPDTANLNFLPLTRTGFMLLGGTVLFVAILGIAGIWGCVSWRSRARWPGGGTSKYQELEMSLPTVDSLKKDTEEGPVSAEGWDEIWEDDEWEDTEAARPSSNLQTLSSQGLNVRHANKDGWDTTWDD